MVYAVHGILQARILEWVAYPFSSRSSRLRKVTKIKHKERILKASREKQQVTYKGNSIHLTADLAAEILQASRGWQNILKVLKGKNLQPRLLYLARISFKTDGEIKNFSNKQKLKENSVPPNQLYNKC